MSLIDHKEDNKRLAKNTLALYFRTLVVMALSLYISRLLLKKLGVDDFGIYSVVGSIVVLFSFINQALTNASQRFISFELGKGSCKETNKVFSAAMLTQNIVVIIVLIFAETIGLWLLNYKLKIPPERVFAANWTFQFSVLTFCIGVLRVPYNATVIAYEKMTFYAYSSILDVLMKLLIVFLITKNSIDKLILYSLLLSCESLIMFFVYHLYCKTKFKTCNFQYQKSNTIYVKLLSFSSWNLLSSSISTVSCQGLVFLINIYYGVVVNAALGIAYQVSSAISSFIGSFETSYRPQIVKSYAQNDILHLNKLTSTTSKLSFALMIIPTLLLVFNMPLVLNIWLGKYPLYTIEFCQMLLIILVFDATTGPYNCAIIATAKIKYYSIALSASATMDLILSFILIKIGISPYLVLLSRILTRGFLDMVIGLYYVRRLIGFSILSYLQECILPIGIILLINIPPLVILYKHIIGWNMLFCSSFLIVFLSGLTIFFILFNKAERRMIVTFFKNNH